MYHIFSYIQQIIWKKLWYNRKYWQLEVEKFTDIDRENNFNPISDTAL